ncbi:hypothetical protein PybrP1_002800, partial [[Pythium] brassicae (nom. inval.)]
MQSASALNAKRKANFGKNVVHASALHVGPATSGPARLSSSSSTSVQPAARKSNPNAPKTLDEFLFLDCCRALAELDFQCNAVGNISVANGFLSLEVLNLSFNCLTARDVEELSNLLRIRELYLSNNCVRSLPPVMDRFSRLETLSLEQNGIAGEDIFAFLAIVPRLRNLNLSHNKIAGFPESALTLEEKRGAGFYSLMYLNLAHNAIAAEESVIFTCELHSLQKLVLYGNPLAHAAVFSHDHSKLAYDPVPVMTAHVTASGLPLEIVIGYPATTRKARGVKSSYENVEIYKMIPNEVALQPPFRTKAMDYMLAESDRSGGKRE